jgi:hypothetical protein
METVGGVALGFIVCVSICGGLTFWIILSMLSTWDKKNKTKKNE